MWPGYHAPCSKLARVETIWVMMTDSTVDSGLTESTVWSEDRIWPGLDSVGGACGAVPLVGGGVYSDLSTTTGMELGTNIDNGS